MSAFTPQVAVVDFNHHRGPEIEFWVSDEGSRLFTGNEWSHLPFLALPDGAHASSEEFSYFTLVDRLSQPGNSKSILGIACTRRIRSDRLKAKSAEVTRSFVQKAVVVLVNEPGALGQLRERLTAITTAWFAQEDFSSSDILHEFQASLLLEAGTGSDDRETHFGLSLRELVYDLRHQTLVLVKCLLLQKRMLFFGSRCERLCLTQFALISLIPNLLDNLQDCAAPQLNTYQKTVNRVTDLQTSERGSLLAYIGLPLQVFGEGAFFSPYTPLQQLDFLSLPTNKSYVAGSTNTLFLAQRDLTAQPDSNNRYSDVLVNLDEASPATKLTIIDPDLRSALSLSAADRRWIDYLTSTVLDTWNPADPSRPSNYGYQGSEDAIRLSFEEYILSLLSSSAYKNHFDNHPNPYLSTNGGGLQDERYPDPQETANDFNNDFLKQWKQTQNYKLWLSLTADSSIFDIVEPRHPTAGGLNVEDVQRRVGAAMAELHIDERVRQGREQAGKAFEVGRERVGAGVARFWKEVEKRRDQSRARNDKEKENTPANKGTDTGVVATTHSDVFDAEGKQSSELPNDTLPVDTTSTSTQAGASWTATLRARAAQVQRPNVDTAQLQAGARENAAKAGAYLSSWSSWAKDRSREWQESRSQPSTAGMVDSSNVDDKEDAPRRDMKIPTTTEKG